LYDAVGDVGRVKGRVVLPPRCRSWIGEFQRRRPNRGFYRCHGRKLRDGFMASPRQRCLDVSRVSTEFGGEVEAMRLERRLAYGRTGGAAN